MTVPVITIDGPSGVGKGTVTRALVRALGWHRLDSGALYRLLALAAERRQLSLDDTDAVASIAPSLSIQFGETPEGDECIWLDGVDVTREVRAEATGGKASRIATSPAVRDALLARQRDFRVAPGLVADGRDMGTVVFPDAVLKIFLDASPMARAERRLAQLRAMGAPAILADLCAEIEARDRRDRGRATAPLVAAEDAVTIDTTHLTPDQVMDGINVLLTARAVR